MISSRRVVQSSAYLILEKKIQQRFFHLSFQQSNKAIPNQVVITTNSDRSKKRMSGYNVFVREQFPLLRKQHTSETSREITKLIGQKWKRMTVEEKQPFVEMAKCEPRIKRPLTAYDIYCREMYLSVKNFYTGLNSQEINQLVADSWKNATKIEKETYYEMARKLKSEYKDTVPPRIQRSKIPIFRVDFLEIDRKSRNASN